MEEDPEVETLSSKKPGEKVVEDQEVSDTELDELLDQSLGEFGKHIPNLSNSTSQQPQSSASASNGSSHHPSASKATPTSASKPHPPFLESAGDVDEIFGSEFVAEAEAQLGEAMKMLSTENPELWEQFETFAKTMGFEESAMGQPAATPPTSGPASKGESSVDANGGAVGGAGGGAASREDEKAASGGAEGGKDSSTLDQKLEETIKRMQDNAARLGPEANHMEGLEDMLSQLDLGSEEGEDHFMKMMQGMMSTLLSKEVLYPSLVDLCKQYPDWLSSHREEVSSEDYQRYSKQLEVMKAICTEFERPAEGGAESSASSEKILQLMQELQQYGQPPDDLAGDSMQSPGIPPGLQNLMGGASGDPQNCTIM